MKKNKSLKNNQYPTPNKDSALWAIDKYVSDENKMFIPLDDLRERLFNGLLKDTFGEDYWRYIISGKNNALIAQMIRTVNEMIEDLPIENGGLTLVNLEGARELALHSPAENAMKFTPRLKTLLLTGLSNVSRMNQTISLDSD